MKIECVIFVDDDMDEHYIFKGVMHKVPSQFVHFYFDNAKAALTHLREKKDVSALMVLDLSMPGMDGKECLREIRELPNHGLLQVLIQTNSIDPEDIKDFERLGASFFLHKCGFDKTVAEFRALFQLLEDGTPLPKISTILRLH